MIDLSLVSTDDLIEEFIKRYDATVVVGMKSKTDKLGELYMNWEGDTSKAIHLCELAKLDVLDSFNDHRTPTEE